MNPFFYVIIGGFGFLLVRQWLINRKPTLIGNATIVARRTEPGKYMRTRSTSGINYIVTFRLSDGEEIELLTGEQEYYILQEGLIGQLHWQGNDFRYFESQD